MSQFKKRQALTALLLVALLVPGVILAQPAAQQAGDLESLPNRSEAPEDFPWQPDELR